MDLQRSGTLVAVVEDDASCRTALGRLLRAEGFDTALFESAEAYIDHPPTPEPLCVIVDVQLPGMSGIELQRRLQTAHSELPVIVTTANRERLIRERAEQNGCVGFFWKPFDGAAIVAALNTLATSIRA
jgi:FixJ family two-component response regulator